MAVKALQVEQLVVAQLRAWSWLSRRGKDAPLGQRLVEHRALDFAPLGDVVSAYDDYVGGNAQPAKLATESDRLRPDGYRPQAQSQGKSRSLSVAGIAAGVGSEQDDLSRLAGSPGCKLAF